MLAFENEVGSVWDQESRLLVLKDLEGPFSQINFDIDCNILSVAFSSDDKILAIGCQNGEIRFSDSNSLEEFVRINSDYEVDGIAFAPDGKSLATIQGGIVSIWLVP